MRVGSVGQRSTPSSAGTYVSRQRRRCEEGLSLIGGGDIIRLYARLDFMAKTSKLTRMAKSRHRGTQSHGFWDKLCLRVPDERNEEPQEESWMWGSTRGKSSLLPLALCSGGPVNRGVQQGLERIMNVARIDTRCRSSWLYEEPPSTVRNAPHDP